MTTPRSERPFDPDLVRRLQHALTGSSEELFQLLLDPAMEVLRAALKNPQLGEEHLLTLLRRRDLTEDLLKAVSRLDSVQQSRRLKLALAKNPATPGPILQSLLPHLYLFELLDLCYLPGVTPDQKLAAERAILQRLPVIPLGNKLTLARRGTPNLLAELIKTGEPQLVDTCLGNHRLKEVAILQFLNGPRSTAETISMVARHPRWKTRPNLQLAILKNPRTPAVWFTLHLPKLRTPDLRGLVASRRLSAPQRILVTEELKKRGQL